MKYNYNSISCYYSKGERLLFLPTGEFLPLGGAIGIEPVSELKFPVEKKVSVIEKYLKIKG